VFVAVDGAKWAEILTGFATPGIVVGVLFAWLQLRDTRKTRDAEIVHKLMKQWNPPRMNDAHRLIGSYTSPQAMADALRAANTRQTDDFYLFTYNPELLGAGQHCVVATTVTLSS
jgi:hypothetical protein